MVNKKLLSIILLLKIFVIHSFPYHDLSNSSNRSTTFEELNNTFREFNKINGTIQHISERKNVTNAPTTRKIQTTTIEILSLDDNFMDEIAPLPSQELNSTVHMKTVLFNSPAQLTTVKMNSTFLDTSAAMNSTIPLANLTLEEVDPIVEILDPIPGVNLTVSLNSTAHMKAIFFNSTTQVIHVKMNSTVNVTVAVMNETIPLPGLTLEDVDPVVEILDPIPEVNLTVSLNSTFPVKISVANSTIPLANLTLEDVDPVVEILDPIPAVKLTVSFNSTVFTEIVEFDQNKTVHFRPDNIILNETLQENIGLNLTEFAEPFVSDLGRDNTYELNTAIKLAYIESFNKSVLSFCPHIIRESIKHAILKYIDSRLSHVCVNLTFNETVNPKEVTRDMLPISLNVTISTPVVLTEDQFNSALIDFSINNKKCSMQNDTEIRCSLFRLKDSSSLLRISDYWIELNQLTPTHQKLNGIEYEIFTYKPAWIVGLAIIGGIIAIFFLGCIVAICYTRRPYRRCGKVYEIDSAVRKNNQPYIPGVHPSTKAATVTKTKELYYQ